MSCRHGSRASVGARPSLSRSLSLLVRVRVRVGVRVRVRVRVRASARARVSSRSLSPLSQRSGQQRGELYLVGAAVEAEDCDAEVPVAVGALESGDCPKDWRHSPPASRRGGHGGRTNERRP